MDGGPMGGLNSVDDALDERSAPLPLSGAGEVAPRGTEYSGWLLASSVVRAWDDAPGLVTG